MYTEFIPLQERRGGGREGEREGGRKGEERRGEERREGTCSCL